jgi:hypothetical protein
MAIQRFAADSGYIVVSDRQHGGAEPRDSSHEFSCRSFVCGRTTQTGDAAIADRCVCATLDWFNALPIVLLRVISIGSALVKPCSMFADGRQSDCEKLPANMVNANRRG